MATCGSWCRGSVIGFGRRCAKLGSGWIPAKRGTVSMAMSAAEAGATWTEIAEWPEFMDGSMVHAPVDSLRANPFGCTTCTATSGNGAPTGSAPTRCRRAPATACASCRKLPPRSECRAAAVSPARRAVRGPRIVGTTPRRCATSVSDCAQRARCEPLEQAGSVLPSAIIRDVGRARHRSGGWTTDSCATSLCPTTFLSSSPPTAVPCWLPHGSPCRLPHSVL